MNKIILTAIILLLTLSINAFAENMDEILDIPEYTNAELDTLTPITPLYRKVSIRGEYFGTLVLRKMKKRGSQTCNASSTRDYSFIVSNQKKRASVYLQNGLTLTGRRKSNSFKTILDYGDYTFRVLGKKCRGSACFFTLKLTQWVTGSNYCQAIYKAWMYADN